MRFASEQSFRDAIAALGSALTERELKALWLMVADLQRQADQLQQFVQETLGPNALMSAGGGADVDGHA